MKKFTPTFLKYPLITLYILGRCLSRGGARKGRVVINLAGALPPEGSIVHGGKVKLLTLQEKFGDSWKNFNLAYFASSGLPFAPALWLKIYRLFGIQTVWNQNGLAYPALYPQKIVERINNILRPIHLADFVVYQTEFTKRCTDKFIGKFSGPSEVIVNPVDTQKFKPQEHPSPQEPLVVIMSGNHFESKERMLVSLEAMRRVREQLPAKLLIIGKPDFETKEEWVEQTGAFTQKEAPKLYQRAHLLLHLKYLDPCPTTVLEALASGLPVVGQNNGGMPELVGNKAGILIESPEDFGKLHYPEAEAVATAIIKIAENLPQFSEEARKQSLQFDKAIWLNKHEEIFKRLLS